MGSLTPTQPGLSEIVPTFETVFVLACHYAVSKLCKGMSHHSEVRHVFARLHIHRFRPYTLTILRDFKISKIRPRLRARTVETSLACASDYVLESN